MHEMSRLSNSNTSLTTIRRIAKERSSGTPMRGTFSRRSSAKRNASPMSERNKSSPSRTRSVNTKKIIRPSTSSFRVVMDSSMKSATRAKTTAKPDNLNYSHGRSPARQKNLPNEYENGSTPKRNLQSRSLDISNVSSGKGTFSPSPSVSAAVAQSMKMLRFIRWFNSLQIEIPKPYFPAMRLYADLYPNPGSDTFSFFDTLDHLPEFMQILTDGIFLCALISHLSNDTIMHLNWRPMSMHQASTNIDKALQMLWKKGVVATKMPEAQQIYSQNFERILSLFQEIFQVFIQRPLKRKRARMQKWFSQINAQYARKVFTNTNFWNDFRDGVSMIVIFHAITPVEQRQGRFQIFWNPEDEDELSLNIEYCFSLMESYDIPVLWSVNEFMKTPDLHFLTLQLYYIWDRFSENPIYDLEEDDDMYQEVAQQRIALEEEERRLRIESEEQARYEKQLHASKNQSLEYSPEYKTHVNINSRLIERKGINQKRSKKTHKNHTDSNVNSRKFGSEKISVFDICPPSEERIHNNTQLPNENEAIESLETSLDMEHDENYDQVQEESSHQYIADTKPFLTFNSQGKQNMIDHSDEIVRRDTPEPLPAPSSPLRSRSEVVYNPAIFDVRKSVPRRKSEKPPASASVPIQPKISPEMKSRTTLSHSTTSRKSKGRISTKTEHRIVANKIENQEPRERNIFKLLEADKHIQEVAPPKTTSLEENNRSDTSKVTTQENLMTNQSTELDVGIENPSQIQSDKVVPSFDITEKDLSHEQIILSSDPPSQLNHEISNTVTNMSQSKHDNVNNFDSANDNELTNQAQTTESTSASQVRHPFRFSSEVAATSSNMNYEMLPNVNAVKDTSSYTYKQQQKIDIEQTSMRRVESDTDNKNHSFANPDTQYRIQSYTPSNETTSFMTSNHGLDTKNLKTNALDFNRSNQSSILGLISNERFTTNQPTHSNFKEQYTYNTTINSKPLSSQYYQDINYSDKYSSKGAISDKYSSKRSMTYLDSSLQSHTPPHSMPSSSHSHLTQPYNQGDDVKNYLQTALSSAKSLDDFDPLASYKIPSLNLNQFGGEEDFYSFHGTTDMNNFLDAVDDLYEEELEQQLDSMRRQLLSTRPSSFVPQRRAPDPGIYF